MLNTSKKFWLVLLLMVWGFVIIFLTWLKTDEPLSKEAEQLLSKVQGYDATLSDHPYFNILGFDARSDLDPQAVGRLKYHQGWKEFYTPVGRKNENELNRHKLSEFKFEYFTDEEEELLKKILDEHDEPMFYQKIFQHKNQLQRLYSKQTVLNDRFQRLVLQFYSRKPLLLSINSEYPNYSLIRRIHLLYLSHLAFQNDGDKIAVYIQQLIQKVNHAENLIEAMVFTSMISHSLDVLNQLDRSQTSAKLHILHLSEDIISLNKLLSVEFAGMSSYWDRLNSGDQGWGIFDHIDENGHLVEVKPLKQILLNGISPFLYLKNMTKNEYARVFKANLEISEQDPLHFKILLKDNQIEPSFSSWRIKNYFGHKLSLIANPNWIEYSIRLRILNQKIQVFNTLAYQRQFELEQLNLNKEGYDYYRNETELCIQSPAPHQDEDAWEKYKSCLMF